MTRKGLAAILLMGWLSSPVMAEEARPVSGLIVKLKKQGAEAGTEQRRLGRVAFAAGYTTLMPWRKLGSGMAVMQAPTRLTQAKAQALMAKAMASGEVEWVEPNVREKRQAAVVPNDPYYNDTPFDDGQWWLQAATTGSTASQSLRQRGAPNINLAWQTTTGQTQASGAIIAVLDTGTLSHPDMASGRILAGYDFVSDVSMANDGGGRDADPTDPGDWVSSTEAGQGAFSGCEQEASSWHGMVITGFLGATSNNGTGVAGINWNARILPVRVAGKCGADVSDIIDGMRWAAGLHVSGVPDTTTPARIINISFGGNGVCGAAYQTAIDEVRAQGAVVVVAAGNEHGAVSRPGNCANVVTVAALNREGFKSTYSNFGSQVFISTVGGDPNFSNTDAGGGKWRAYLADTGMLGLYNYGTTTAGTSGYAYHAGTSYAAPVVAGVLSLMLDVDPTLTVSQLEDGLRLSARKHVISGLIGACSSGNPGRCMCTTSTCGHGILDAQQAIVYASAPSSYVPPVWPDENIDSTQVGQAVLVASADRVANVTGSATTNGQLGNDGGGGGGGAFDAPVLLGEGLLVLLLAARRRRFLKR